MPTRIWKPAILLAAFAPCCTAALANDTELTYGGTPRPLNGNTTISMKSELVRMVVGDKSVSVDCQFVFHNNGPARKVRMGFPDQGGEDNQDENGKPLPPVGSFTTFKSWFDGKPVKTSVIRGTEYGDVWHVKLVEFPAHRTVKVRDRYTVDVGSSVAFSPYSVHLAEYVLHTGSSWHGPLGRSVVEVEFQRASVGSPLIPIEMKGSGGSGAQFGQGAGGKRRVFYRGPCRPTAAGSKLRFVRTNWRPTKKDDIVLLFDVRRPGKAHRAPAPQVKFDRGFYPYTHYFVLGSPPKAVRDFEAFGLFKDQHGKPAGYVITNRENPDDTSIDIKNVVLAPPRLRFDTAARKGIRFHFSGEFLKSGDLRRFSEKPVALLEAVVTRFVRGRKTGEGRMRFKCVDSAG